ncbi:MULTISPECIES: Yip1 family protein [Streptomyces]|uniref:Yip1 family protein n=1 Tax=Streptomyces TaxID=1883 RepID=UPI001E456436|nr:MULTISPECIES: Yip1 family protein [Streptomyces]UFQ17003.1 YIP1 family protein [Streptomyces huasconensis]WCL86603.1 Yip1 family protein [Streptomyces sp. JCM 35825]
MAGFRIGRGRDNRAARPQQQPRQQPYGQQSPQGQQQSYGYPPAPPNPQQYGGGGPQYGGGGPQYGGGGPQPGRGGQQWPQADGGHGEPEYFGGPDGQGHGPQGGYDPYAANNPGHTQAFSIGEDPYHQGDTYRAGQPAAAPIGPRLHWKDLLRGIVLRPGPTFLQMRDYAMWGPALVVTFLYGLLAIFGFDDARTDAINATLSSVIPYVLTTGVAITISAFILGVVTHTLARQLGGDGAWQPTVGLSMLIMSLTDAPRVIVAMFFGGGQSFVQLLGWATWLAAGALLTTMVSKSHDLPWPRALGAASIQLLAILSIIKLGTF